MSDFLRSVSGVIQRIGRSALLEYPRIWKYADNLKAETRRVQYTHPEKIAAEVYLGMFLH